MWPNLGDLAIIYAVLTPTSVLYWHTTALLLHQWIGNSAAQLVVGFASAVAIAFLHDVFRNNAPSSPPIMQSAYETAYDYIVTLSCLCYHLGCRTIYDALIGTGFLQPIHVAALAALVLVSVRGFRNVLSLPLVVNSDNSVERYRPLSTLTFSAGTPRSPHLMR